MAQRRHRVFHDRHPRSFSPGRAAAGRAVDLGGAVVFGVLPAKGVVHRVAVGRERGGALVELRVDLVLQFLGGEPVALLVFFHDVEVVGVLPGDRADFRVLVARAGGGEIELVVVLAR